MSFGIVNANELDVIYKTTDFQAQLSNEQIQDINAYYNLKESYNQAIYSGFDEYTTIGSKWRDIPTTSSSINSILHGGLKQGTITEISGRGATGKTQFCMMLCATVQIPNTPLCQYQAM